MWREISVRPYTSATPAGVVKDPAAIEGLTDLEVTRGARDAASTLSFTVGTRP